MTMSTHEDNRMNSTTTTNAGAAGAKAQGKPEQAKEAELRGSATDDDEDDEFSDYESSVGDVQAYWDSASPPDIRDWRKDHNAPPKFAGTPNPVHFEPLYVSLSDSSIKPGKNEPWKQSALIHGRLLTRCRLRPAEKGSEDALRWYEEGTHIGIWAKPGMRELNSLKGVKVLLDHNGFKDIGQPSLMVDFKIRFKGKGEKLEVPPGEDRRDKSLPESVRKAREAAGLEDDSPF